MELHLELEKEQEGIVNRLTRELSQLRSQTQSVASTTSSTSDVFLTDHNAHITQQPGGIGIVPTSARRHRSSSNLSARSDRHGITSTSTTSVSGIAGARERETPGTSSRPSMDVARPNLSRQNSNVSVTHGHGRRSITPASPSLTNSQIFSTSQHPHRQSLTSASSFPDPGSATHPRSPSFSQAQAVAQARYEEAAYHRAELDAVKKENEALRQRIKDLEKSLSHAITTRAGTGGTAGLASPQH